MKQSCYLLKGKVTVTPTDGRKVRGQQYSRATSSNDGLAFGTLTHEPCIFSVAFFFWDGLTLQAVTFGKGDFVTFPAGMSCQCKFCFSSGWNIHSRRVLFSVPLFAARDVSSHTGLLYRGCPWSCPQTFQLLLRKQLLTISVGCWVGVVVEQIVASIRRTKWIDF